MVKELKKSLRVNGYDFDVAILLDLNNDETVNLQKTMKVSYVDRSGNKIEKEIYPDVHVNEGSGYTPTLFPGRQNFGTINDQFELIKADIKFNEALNSRS